MPDDPANLTAAQRAELLQEISCAVQGICQSVIAAVHDQHVDSDADQHRAVLCMLQAIKEFGSDVCSLSDEDENLRLDYLQGLMQRLGMEKLQEVAHG